VSRSGHHALSGLFNDRRITIAQKYSAAEFRPTGFDYLRIILAVSLVLWHAIVSVNVESWSIPIFSTQWKLPLLFLVPSFFALSGFLIAGSLERSTIPVFIGLRILRIVPALTVDTLLTMFIVGPLFTILTLREYFSNKETWKYLWNIIGHIHYRLPGVFYHNPIPEIINGQLWTIPWEFVCYATIVVLALLGIAGSRRFFLIVAVIAPIVVLTVLTTLDPGNFGPNPQAIAPSNTDLVLCFIAGVAIYKYRDVIPHNLGIALLCVVGYAVLMNTHYAYVFTSLLVAYITVWIGVANHRKIFIIKGGDYSYGIYLYHMTLQQVLVAFGLLTWYSVFIVSLPLVTLIAALSWHFVEKPTLSLRPYLTKRNPPQAAQTVVIPQEVGVRKI
jgi:peptidoglycan/LPS O-acetylase OafA/YrhL